MDCFFDAETVETSGFDPIPAGRYRVLIVGAERKTSKDGRSEFVELMVKIDGGEYDGRRIWDRCLIRHPNPQAEGIGRGRLKSLCEAIGVTRLTNAEELLNYRATVVLKVKPHRDTGEMQNEVGRYLPEGTPSLAAPTATKTAAPVAPAPWKPAVVPADPQAAPNANTYA